MSKPNKKIYLSSFLLIFCMLLFTALYGCGTGADTVAAPGPTTSLKITVVATPESVNSGQTSIIVAKVLNADDTPAAGQIVTFQFAGGAVTGPSGATLSVLNSGTTDISGEALAVYTAGSVTDSIDINDTVTASVTGTVGVIIITRSAATIFTPTGYKITSFVGIPETTMNARFSTFAVANCELMVTVGGTSGGFTGIPVTFSIFRGPGALPTVKTVDTDTNGEAWIFFDIPVPSAGEETIVRATVPLISPQTKGGDAVSIIYW